jgi:protein-tyrosine phosphatase
MRQISSYALWLGHAGDGRNPRLLLDSGIQAVVQLALEEEPLRLPREIIVCRFPLLDGGGNDPGLLDLAVTTVANLVEKKIPTLVCCGAGMSRSPAVAAVALAIVYQENADECLKRLAEHHPSDVMPGLWNDLKTVLQTQFSRPS